MPVAVHGVEQEAVGDLPPAAGAPLPGEGARRDRGRLRAAAGVHHGLLPLYIAKGRGAPLGVPEEVFLQRNKHSARSLAGWRQPPARQGAD